jgi:hypothetical protein
MIELLQRLRRLEQGAKLVENIAKLASREREVRTLERLIEYISSLDDEDLARVWPRLIAAVYSQSTSQHTSPLKPRSTPDGKLGRVMTRHFRQDTAIVDSDGSDLS